MTGAETGTADRLATWRTVDAILAREPVTVGVGQLSFPLAGEQLDIFAVPED